MAAPTELDLAIQVGTLAFRAKGAAADVQKAYEQYLQLLRDAVKSNNQQMANLVQAAALAQVSKEGPRH